MQIEYNNTIIDVKKGTKVLELLKKEIGKRNNEIIACKFNNEVKSLNYEINSNGKLELIDITNKDGMRIYKRGLIYIVAKAFRELYPEALITVNYQLYHSMLCELDNLEVTEEMIEKVNKRVKEIIKLNLPITKEIMSKEKAMEFYIENLTQQKAIRNTAINDYYYDRIKELNYFDEIEKVILSYMSNDELMELANNSKDWYEKLYYYGFIKSNSKDGD